MPEKLQGGTNQPLRRGKVKVSPSAGHEISTATKAALPSRLGTTNDDKFEIRKQKPRESLGAFEILNDACQINRNSPPIHVKHQNESSSDN